ncbi:hypothetical protein [Priestia endophytica]|nr:hypothetical protein [Priestia endophytica]
MVQREEELVRQHNQMVSELEKNMLENYKGKSFLIEGEEGHFAMKGIENNHALFQSKDKQIEVPLSEFESTVKAIEREREITPPFIQTEPQKSNELATGEREREDINRNFNVEKESTFVPQNSEDPNDKSLNESVERETQENINPEIYVQDNGIPNEDNQREESKEPPSIALNENVQENVSFERERSEDDTREQERNDEGREDGKQAEVRADAIVVPSNIRGQMEAISYLKQMSAKEIVKQMKEAQKEAQRNGEPLHVAYKANLQEHINERVEISRERVLDKSIKIHDKSDELRMDLREAERKINQSMGMLQQAKLEQKISQKEYESLKEKLDEKKAELHEREAKVDRNEKKMENQLKSDLKEQYPGLKTDKLTMAETIAIATASSQMINEKTVENLRSFSLENELKGAIQSIDKANKEIEHEIEETLTISR